MKLALFADIHSNLEALTECLAHARALRPDRYVFLGDLVGYGADPVAVVDLVEQHVGEGALAVLGNHDAAAIGKHRDYLNAHAEAAIAWTHSRLGERQRAFLSRLPLAERLDNMLFVHASAALPERWTYVSSTREAQDCLQATDASYVFCGHVHEQKLYYAGADGHPLPFRPVPGTPIPVAKQRRWLAIAGSAGQPRDGNNAACYAFFDSDRERLTFFRVAYEHARAAEKILAAGLPRRLALRLESGT